MRDSTKPFDIGIVTVYMGRFATLIVAVLVLAITVHALVTWKSDRSHVKLSVAVATRPGVGGPELYHEAIAQILAQRTARSVSLVYDVDAWADSCELFVLPILDFARLRGPLGLRGLYALGAATGDRAVLIARGESHVDLASASSTDVLFAAPTSPNACWEQLMALSERGVAVPGKLDGLHFASPGGDCERVVYSVVNGVRPLGACRSSDLAALIRRGALEQGEVSVVLAVPAAPEAIVAARERDAEYFRDHLDSVDGFLHDPSLSPRDRDAVGLLRDRGVGSFRPLSPAQLERLEALVGFVSTRIE